MEGTVLSIREHVPPRPFESKDGLFYGESPRKYNNYQDGDGFPCFRDAQLSYVLENPPIETVPPGPEEFDLTIKKVIIGPKRQYFDSQDDDSETEDQEDDGRGDVVEYDPNYFVPGPYRFDDLPELKRKDPHLPLDDEPYNGAIVVVGNVQLRGDQAPREYVAKIYDGAYYPVSFSAEVQRGRQKPDDGVAPDCATRADLDYAAESAAYRMIQESPQPGPRRATLGFHGSWTFALPGSDLETKRHRWVRMVLLEKVDATPMSQVIRQSKQVKGRPLPSESERLIILKNLIDADEELWWWCQINYKELQPHDVLIKKDGTVKIINFHQAILYACVQDDRFLCHPRTLAPEMSEEDLKATGERVSPVHRYWPFNVYTHTVESWPLVDAPSRPWETERGNWDEWVPVSWLSDPEEAAIWLLKTYRNDERYSPLDEVFLDHPDHMNRTGRLLELLEQFGRKPAAELEAIRLAELD
ncbi:hypothetical protein B0T21DRAFT_284141, partial [Apiosordaria backusii]